MQPDVRGGKKPLLRSVVSSLPLNPTHLPARFRGLPPLKTRLLQVRKTVLNVRKAFLAIFRGKK